MPRTTVGVEFGQGMDSKTDPKVTAKPTLMQDCIFTSPKQVRKRNGHDAMTLNIAGGGTISSPTMDASYRGELLVAGSGSNGPRLFSYSPSQNVWIDRGKYISIGNTKQIIAAPELATINNATPSATFGSENPSGAYISGIAAYAYDGPNVSTVKAVYYSIVDTASGAHLADGQISSAYGALFGYSKIIALGSTCFGIFYISIAGGVAKLCMKTLTVSSGAVTVGSEKILNTISTGDSVGNYVYDVITTTGGAFVALGNGSAVVLYTIDTTGNATHGPTTIVTAGSVGVITLQLDPTGTNAWIYWLENLNTIKGAIYNASSLVLVLAATQIQNGLSNVRQLSAFSQNATNQLIYWSTYNVPTGFTNGVVIPKIWVNGLNQGGSTGLTTAMITGFDLYSKPFTVSGRNYMAVMALSQSNPIGLIVDLADFSAVAKFLPGSAEGLYCQGYNTGGGSYATPSLVFANNGIFDSTSTARGIRNPGFVTVPFFLSSTQIGMACGFVVSVSDLTPVPSGNLGVCPNTVLVSALMGVASMTFDFNHIDAYQNLLQQNTLVLNGSIVSQYDGAQVTELGFTVDPDQVQANGSTTLGVLGTGKFVYYVVFEWTDANGNLHQSAPSQPLTVNFTSGTTNLVNLQWGSLNLSQKKNVVTRIYRTIANGTNAYLIATIQNSGSFFDTFQDNNAPDSVIQGNPPLYTLGDSVLPNIAPPPALTMWTANNRISVVDSEDPTSKIEYCKTASEGSGISFSTGFLEYVVDSFGGAIRGGSRMDEKQVVLKENAIGYFIGDGADDSGNGSTLTPIQFIPADTGCTNGKSVISYPGGILFRSPKGIYQLNRGLQLSYFGTDVEAYNSQDIRSAQLIYDKNQIRFLTSSGSNLLYDYIMGQWSIFSSPAGLSACSFQGLYVYVTADGRILKENTTTFLDAGVGYAPLIDLQWIKATSVQSMQRCRAIELIGDYAIKNNGHGIQVSVAWDYVPTFSIPVPYLFTDQDQNGLYEYRQHLARQKGAAFKLRIQEIITGASGEFIDFTDLDLEITPKVGMNKLGGSKSVG